MGRGAVLSLGREKQPKKLRYWERRPQYRNPMDGVRTATWVRSTVTTGWRTSGRQAPWGQKRHRVVLGMVLGTKN